MKSNLTKLAAAGALTLSATAGAMAGSVTQPGENAGLATGAPLPQGIYFVDTFDWGTRSTSSGTSASGLSIPILLWSTPWKFLGGRVELALATPWVEAGTEGAKGVGSYNESLYNPYIGGFLAWDLGHGFGFSYGLGAYIGVTDVEANPSTFLNNRFGLSYTANGWNLTANVVYGNALDTSIATSPDYLNLDLTATKTFGKWEVGAVGYYSTDLGTLPVNDANPKQSQFAAGALVGYDWGAVKTQLYFTRDVWQEGYGGYDTRVWARVILPLGDPFAGTPSSFYHK
jgi:hypothetical protein